MAEKHHKNLAVWYYEYKDSTLFAGVMFLGSMIVTVVLLLFMVIPQFQSWFATNSEAEATRERIAVLNKNIQFIQSQNDSTLDQDFNTTITALPQEKDFAGGMQAILTSAVNAGVSLDEFQFTVGSITSSQSAQPVSSSLDLAIDVLGDPVGVNKFIHEVSAKLPVAIVLSTDARKVEAGDTRINISFPAKPMPDVSYDRTTPLPVMTQKSRQLLDLLASWNVPLEDPTDASSSAELLSEPPF